MNNDIAKDHLNQICIETSKLGEVLKNINDQYKPIYEQFEKYRKNLLQYTEPLKQALSGYQEQLNSIRESFSKINFGFIDEIKKLQINSAVISFNESLINALKGSPLPEEEQNKIILKATEYSNYGIPYPINDSIGDVQKRNVNDEYVNDICERYSSGEDFESIKKAMLELENTNHQQIKECISCFENKEYYACCSILFGIIDRELISSQPINEKKRRSAYNRKIVEDRKNNPKNENHWWKFFWKINMLQLFSYYYKDGDDFKDESVEKYPVINRNFIAHGMTNRTITNKDCIKLFLFVCYLKYEIKNLIEISAEE